MTTARLLVLLAACALPAAVTPTMAAAAPAARAGKTATTPAPAPVAESRILATVNGDVISNIDVDSRGRLFAMSTGLAMSPAVLDRLKPQILRQLIDERLRMQEIERRHIVVPDKEIAAAIHEIETRNGLPAGTLRQRLVKAGISPLTLIDQIRTQLGWTQVLRQQLGEKANISSAEIAERQRLLQQAVGQPEFQVGEIFIPVDNPNNAADAEHFAETVITDLRAGAPFGLVAAQFSQDESALQGGELGWVGANQLDPAVAKLVQQMPVGAISNPIPVPGGLSIVTVQGKREIGHDMATVLSIRQVFLPFTAPLNARNPTEQQRAALQKARQVSASVHSCQQMEQAAKADDSPRPADPGEIRLETINPPVFRDLLAKIPLDHATQPLVASDGISIMIVCSREQKNLAQQSKEAVREQILTQRVSVVSRQLQHGLHRQANINIRQSGA